jgi:hypothetical protein
MDRPLAAGAIEGAPQRLAPGLRRGRLNRHDLADVLLQRGGPGDEGCLETFRVERVEHVRKSVVARDAVVERQKALQKIELGFAVFLDLDPALGTAQHTHQAAQQQLRQRIEHLCLLPRLRHLLEKLQPTQPVPHRPTHREPPPSRRFSIRSFQPEGNPSSHSIQAITLVPAWPDVDDLNISLYVQFI